MSIEKYEGSTITESLEAASVAFNPESKHWTAPTYITRSFDGRLETFSQHEKLDTLINLEMRELGKLSDIIQTMNISELNEFITQQAAKGSDQLGLFEVERQNRFAYPMATFVLTIIGVSLSSRKSRGGTGLHIGVGIGLCFTYIMFCKFAEELAKNSTAIPAWLVVWVPNLIFAGIAIYLYRKAPK
jgi:lipopolysaccharide export system permease protein